MKLIIEEIDGLYLVETWGNNLLTERHIFDAEEAAEFIAKKQPHLSVEIATMLTESEI